MEQYLINKRTVVKIELTFIGLANILVAFGRVIERDGRLLDLYTRKSYCDIYRKIDKKVKKLIETEDGKTLIHKKHIIILDLVETARILTVLNNFIVKDSRFIDTHTEKVFIDLFEKIKKAADDAIFK